jgi:membrane protein
LLLVFGERIGEAVAGSLGFGDVFTRFWNVLRWPALVVFLLMGVSLVYYVSSVGSYDTYGSVGGVLLLMLWLYLSSVALLLGAQVDSEIARAAGARATGPD